jgi:hypothetical protein
MQKKSAQLGWLAQELRELGRFTNIPLWTATGRGWPDGAGVNFCSNNRASQPSRPAPQQAAIDIWRLAGAVRTIAGTMTLHETLEPAGEFEIAPALSPFRAASQPASA